MSKKLHLSFLWHMHQPIYKNPLTEIYEMPWVFLHAIKDYCDMPWHVSRYNIKVSFNLVPSLLIQLKDYENKDVNCMLIKTIKKNVTYLNPDEKSYLLNLLFSSNLKTMIYPFQRYYELFNKKLKTNNPEDYENQEILDLEVLFLLSWTGNYIREKSKLIKKLIEKGFNYTEEEKSKLLDELFSFIKEIVPFYKKLYEEGKIDLTTSAFYHPIIPLLIDIKSAKESVKNIKLPKVDISFKDDADAQVKNAIDYFKNTFDFVPEGIWPPEGSISEESLTLFYKNGFKITASDEEVLFNSLKNKNKVDIYKLYNFDGINIIFRDKQLSDLIGFVYSSWNPKSAAEDFVNRLRCIYDTVSFNPLVPVILDGENAWEFYYNNGKDFFDELYSLIEKQEWIETVKISEIENLDIQNQNLKEIVAGSWIGGNFLTWIGDDEKNTAWEYLGKVKTLLLEKNIKDEDITEKLYTAEGSDWFWWYGNTHYSPYADKFYILFRSNLMYIYKKTAGEVPDYLQKPIKKEFKKPYIRLPNYYISPVLDGFVTSYYEWINAGIIDLKYDASAMDTSNIHLSYLYYGYDKENLYLMVKGKIKEILDKNYLLGIDLVLKGKKAHIRIPVSTEKREIQVFDIDCKDIEYAAKDVIEIKIPKKCLNDTNIVEISLKLFEEDKTIEKLPFYSFAPLDLSKNFDYEWYI